MLVLFGGVAVRSLGCGVTSRGEYDGSEWWNVQKPFVMPEETREINSLFVKNYDSRFQDLGKDGYE